MANLAQRSFSGGELAPELHARTDLARYATGLATCRNFIVQRQGGVTNRPGTDYVGELADAKIVARILPFVFNASQTYVLEFTDLLLRFIRAGAYIESGGFPYTIPTPYLAADLATLQITQSADVVTIVHPNYATRELRRTSDTSWALAVIDFGPSILAPANVAVTGGEADASKLFYYAVTSVKEETGEESTINNAPAPPPFVGAIATLTAFKPTADDPATVTWDAVAGAARYNVYRQEGYSDGTWGWIGDSEGLQFLDAGVVADPLSKLPVSREPFDAAGDFPAAVSHYQQRRVYAGSDNNPEKVFASRTADPHNFRLNSPILDDDPVTFTMLGKTVNAVKHLIDLGRLLILTSAAEFVVEGDDAGILRPGEVNPRKISENGSGSLAPLVVDKSVLYVQARGTAIRDLTADAGESDDRTVFAAHLFDGFSVVDWAFQQIPHAVAWVVRSDGVLLGLTYLREHQVVAWHRHDTDGAVENVCVVPEGSEDAVYLVVRRTIGGATVRYVERMASRFFTEIADAHFMDSAVDLDGTNESATTMMFTGGTTWAYDETLTLAASAAFFAAADVGSAIHVTAADGTVVRFTIEGYVSPTAVTGHPHMTVPASLRDVATAVWSKAVAVLGGLDHLEGKAVAVFADGFVVASPNNPAAAVRTVTGGQVTLDRPYVRIRAGLPYISDLQTLDIDTPQGPSLKEKKMLINRVMLPLYQSRGVFVGASEPTGDNAVEGLYELKLRDTETMADPVTLSTGTAQVDIDNGWNSSGRVFVRQVDPVPLTILAAIPQGHIPGA